ncbi:hypothetical protein MN032_16055 [Agromyces atrinae]|uniref:hypothetical protein n=1 Tax=Agromyces atrinae TaxID=592376 RepID=UPI001F569A7E|nr:hypothetical protein [Agromyces atrinae]MCI2959203.1 hypothetical protein [Agromyces atrinae]
MNRAGVALAAVAALLALAGCSAPTQSAPSSPGDGLEARVFQYRLDYLPRVLEVGLENTGESPLDIRSVRFDSDLFEAPAITERGTLLKPGAVVDLRVDLPAPRCSGAPGAESVIVTLTDGTEISLVPTDDQDTLARINDEDCLAEAVGAVATLTLPSSVRRSDDGAGASGWIDIAIAPEPTGETPLVIDRVLGTTLLSAVTGDGASWPVDRAIRPGDEPSMLSLAVRPTRCDPHAVAEDKIGTILPVEVRIGERAGVVDLAAGDALKADVYAFVAEVCGF